MPYGKFIPSLGSRKTSTYGFVNETAIRVGAGIMFTIGLITFLSVYYAGKYHIAVYIVGLFFLDFLLKVINPRYSYIGALANFLVRNKEPLRVGAIQKRFAWTMGLLMSGTVFVALINRICILRDLSHTPETLSRPMYICLICLVFMWLEAILGRCAGCRIFGFLTKNTIFGFLVEKNIIKNPGDQVCADGSCAL